VLRIGNVNVYYRVVSASTSTRRRGAELEHALYEATVRELAESGYGRLTMEGVAARARTGKAAVYRRWSTKQALVLDALRHSLPPLPGFEPEMPPRENLRAVFTVLCQVFGGRTSFPGLAVITGLVADPVLRNAIVEHIVSPRLRVIESILDNAVRTGEIDAVRPMAVHIGPALVMHSFLLTGNPPGEAEIDQIVDSVLGV
jgi:AcrR family transcriptional regulator